MTRIRTLIALFTLGLLVAGCGFTPLYAENPSGEGLVADFEGVYIAPIPDRIGQQVRNHLLDRINPMGEPSGADYTLRVTLEPSVEGFGFRSDESITRESLTLTAYYQLVDQRNGNVVLEDQVRAIQAYDVVQSDFANFSAQQDAEARTTLQVAELLTARLGLFFKSAE